MKHCCICSTKKTATHKAHVFTSAGTSVHLNLCQEHDIELFKLGQLKFCAKHRLALPNSTVDDDQDSINQTIDSVNFS